MFRVILAIFFLLNAIFWGLFPHRIHCKLVGEKCPPHYIHLAIGLVSFIIAVMIMQSDYLFS